MDNNNNESIQRLENLLKKMDVPPNRKRVNLNNLKWLSKNLGDRNSDTPNYEEAIGLIEESINNKYYTY